MSYFPLQVISELSGALGELLDTFGKTMSEDIGKEIVLDNGFPEFVLSDEFFYSDYNGKYKEANSYLLNNKQINKLVLQGIHFSDWHQRRTEWRDLFGEYYVLNEWRKSKVVYKIDNEFFHEIKNTGNLKVSRPMFEYLPVHTMYFDLSDVKDIADFKGAWVHINKVSEDQKNYLFTVYMVTDGSIRKDGVPAFFSYYCGFRFNNDDATEIDLKEALSDVVDSFHISDYRSFSYTGEVIRQPLSRADDHRPEIVTAVLQILQFLHAQIDDISENPITKSTYKPSATIKDKFSEVRMWDVGVRYGKAIKFAKQEMEKEIKLISVDGTTEGTEKKSRKPVRPHIRSAHWQRYHVGEGRKQIKVNWIPPVYVCGGKEIAVTIHKVS